MNTKQIGNIGEAAVLFKMVELGIPIYTQFGDNEAADYIIIVDNKPLKVQVKTSVTYDGNTTHFDLTSSTVHRKNGVKHIYSLNEVDFFACYDTNTKEIYIVPNDGNMSSITFRHTMPVNGQVKNIHFSKNYLLCVETLHEISKNIG